MLNNCPECGGLLSSTASFCPHCGYSPKPQRKPQRRTRRKLPNGFGSIRKMSGHRVKPYAAYPPITDYHDNGSAILPKAIGYYASYQDAYNALSEWKKSPYDLEQRTAIFAEVYEAFMRDKFCEGNTLSKKTRQSYVSAYSNTEVLHKRVFSLLRKEDFQKVVDDLPLKHASKELLVSLFKQMGKFALAHDIVIKDYAQFVSVNTENDDINGVPFTEEEILDLVKRNDSVGLILLYTGMRISELETIVREDEHFYRGGLKTKAGRNRLIPIHPAIENVTIPEGYSQYKYRKQFAEWYPNHTPHDLRHTTTWLLQTYGADDLSTRMILGHSRGNDIEKNTYGHRTPEQLYEAILKIPDFRA